MRNVIQIVCVVVVSLGSAVMAVDIETVPVGNPLNQAAYDMHIPLMADS